MRPYWLNWSLVFPHKFTVGLTGDPHAVAQEIIEQIAYRLQRENASNLDFNDTHLLFGPMSSQFLGKILGGKVSIIEGHDELHIESHLVIGVLPNLALLFLLPFVPFADNSMLVIVSVALLLLALVSLPIWFAQYRFHARIAESIAVVVEDTRKEEVPISEEQRRWIADPNYCPACGTRVHEGMSVCPSCDLSLRE